MFNIQQAPKASINLDQGHSVRKNKSNKIKFVKNKTLSNKLNLLSIICNFKFKINQQFYPKNLQTSQHLIWVQNSIQRKCLWQLISSKKRRIKINHNHFQTIWEFKKDRVKIFLKINIKILICLIWIRIITGEDLNLVSQIKMIY